MPSELTPMQFRDLAHHFLGHAWNAEVLLLPSGPWYQLQNARTGEMHCRDSIRDVFRSVGITLPVRPRYTAHRDTVMFNDEAIATARSSNLAQRIAAALNKHTPNRRGI